MIPVKKSWTNIVMGEGQDHVLPCPAYRDPETGEITIAFSLTDEEVEMVAKSKTVMLNVHTYNNPMQPVQMWAVDEKEKPIDDHRLQENGSVYVVIETYGFKILGCFNEKSKAEKYANGVVGLVIQELKIA